MTRPAPYNVWGLVDGREVGPYPQLSIVAAARTANKMTDQGVVDVRVTDAHGEVVPQDKLDLVWTDDAAHSLIKRRRMDGR
ncbi:MAG: hypothetical protein Q7T60_13590 [Sphingopyxis sp.]|nr:hypothetical protein [Sphingopyxis sp.]